TSSVTISEPSAVTATMVDTVNVNCFGENTGSATVAGSGGTGGSYTFLWSNGQTTAQATGLTAGTYSVTVSDSNNCQDVTSILITEPSTPITAVIYIDTVVGCYNGGNGDIHVDVSGGTAFNANPNNPTGYNYTWTNGSIDSFSITLFAGQHCVTVTDSLACSEIVCITLTQPTQVTASVGSIVNVACNGDSTGTATAAGAGGQPAPYTFLWSANTGSQTTATVTGLAANTNYSVTVYDQWGCRDSVLTVTVTEPNAISVSITPTNLLCNGTTPPDGSALASASGGTGSFGFQWDTAAGNQSAANATGLAPGSYSVTATDANLCTATSSVTITEPTEITASISSYTNISCIGLNDGTATASGGGGAGNYTFLWDISANNQTTATATGLIAGTYIATVTDQNGCSDTTQVVITEPTQVTAVLTTSPVTCNGGNDGSATAVASGGTTGINSYTYDWGSGSVSSSTSPQVAAGSYTVTIADANGCTITENYTITEPSAISFTVGNTNVSCFGGNNGTSNINVSGGSGNFTFLWNNGQTTNTITGLQAGSYCVTATDSSSCTIDTCIVVNEPPSLSINSFTNIDVSCFSLCDGQSTVTVSGGTLPYNYLWGDGQNTSTATGLCASTHSVTITDGNGCTINGDTTITEPTILQTSLNVDSISCIGISDGAITATPIGGTPPYSFIWDNAASNQNTAIATGLSFGNFTVTVTDNNGCTMSTNTDVPEPLSLIITGTTTSTLCTGDSSGTLSASASGGSITFGPFQYSLDGMSWQNDTLFTGLTAGIYNLTVQDGNGCSVDTQLVVQDADPFFITSMTQDTTIEYLDSLTVEAIVNDTSGVLYSWTELGDTPILLTDSNYSFNVGPPNLVSYQFTATNSNGCVVDSIVTIMVTKPRRANAPNAFTPNDDGVNDFFFIQGGDKVDEITLFRIYDRWGNLMFEGSNLEVNVPEQGWDGSFKNKPCTSGAYVWYATVLFKDGETEFIKGDVLLLR
ncbi:MAG: gliding motility-associated C-terminal domain-containing protein, partial [Saprospiraceae bacterium]|nr:gliding motility-associated C-terminal domain-containing protein [Saprospiraceae bacterium]